MPHASRGLSSGTALSQEATQPPARLPSLNDPHALAKEAHDVAARVPRLMFDPRQIQRADVVMLSGRPARTGDRVLAGLG